MKKTTFFILAIIVFGCVAVSPGVYVEKRITVEDFGAKGDGVTNDQVAFQAMVDSLNYIDCLSRTYLIDSNSAVAIRLGKDSTDCGIEIKGNGATIILPPTPTDKILFNTWGQDVYIHDLIIKSINKGTPDSTLPGEESSNWQGV